jgi:hypothetical protein
LAREPRAVVVGPERRRRQERVQLPLDLDLGEREGVRPGRRGNDNPVARQRHRLDVLRESPGDGVRSVQAGRRQQQRRASRRSVLEETSTCKGRSHGQPPSAADAAGLTRSRCHTFRESATSSIRVCTPAASVPTPFSIR